MGSSVDLFHVYLAQETIESSGLQRHRIIDIEAKIIRTRLPQGKLGSDDFGLVRVFL